MDVKMVCICCMMEQQPPVSLRINVLVVTHTLEEITPMVKYTLTKPLVDDGKFP